MAATGRVELDPTQDEIVASPVPAGTYTVTVTVTASNGSLHMFVGGDYVVG